jgi:hypothetical protein
MGHVTLLVGPEEDDGKKIWTAQREKKPPPNID